MANRTIYPYGPGGHLPANIGIIDDLKTGGADKALSAEQGKVLNEEVHEYLGTGKNLFDPTDPDYVKKQRLASNGGVLTSAIHAVSGFIPFTQEMGHLCCSTAGSQSPASDIYNCVYDQNKRVIASTTAMSLAWQEGVAYARFTIHNYANGRIQIEVGETATAYEPYMYGIKGEKILDGSVPGSKIADGSIPASKLSGGTSLHGEVSYSAMGGESRLATRESLDGATMTMTNFPRYLKRSRTISMSAKITSFRTIFLGVAGGNQQANKFYVKVDTTKVSLIHLHEDVDTVVAEATHGMTFSTFIKVVFMHRNHNAKVILSTLSSTKTFNFDTATVESYGYPFLRAENASLTDVRMRVGSADLRRPVWVFGDSYVSFYGTRWPFYLLPEKADTDNYAMFGLAGSDSATMLADLQSALLTNRPKYIVWCLGMNENDSGAANGAWKTAFDTVAGLCTEYGITLIAATIPNVPNRRMIHKNAYVRASGFRYIDFAKAVNAEEENATWYEGCLDSDNVHPTSAGAKVLASQVWEDFPEMMNMDDPEKCNCQQE
jgi:hypothetical protein